MCTIFTTPLHNLCTCAACYRLLPELQVTLTHSTTSQPHKHPALAALCAQTTFKMLHQPAGAHWILDNAKAPTAKARHHECMCHKLEASDMTTALYLHPHKFRCSWECAAAALDDNVCCVVSCTHTFLYALPTHKLGEEPTNKGITCDADNVAAAATQAKVGTNTICPIAELAVTCTSNQSISAGLCPFHWAVSCWAQSTRAPLQHCASHQLQYAVLCCAVDVVLCDPITSVRTCSVGVRQLICWQCNDWVHGHAPIDCNHCGCAALSDDHSAATAAVLLRHTGDLGRHTNTTDKLIVRHHVLLSHTSTGGPSSRRGLLTTLLCRCHPVNHTDQQQHFCHSCHA